jgi:hypothetical protein
VPLVRISLVGKATSSVAVVALFLASAGAAQSPRAEVGSELTTRLVAAAVARAEVRVRYVPDYVSISYPGGDVPADTGVCTDEIIRIYRAVRIDLQKEVHEDIVRDRSAYPRVKARPDVSIDHRRVPNLMAYFARHGEALPISTDASQYSPGDIVVWELKAGHIGMVTDRKDPSGARPLVLHNVGRGPMIEDALFEWRIIGHYRYPVAGVRRP